MAVDVTLQTITSGYNTSKINNNFTALQTALDDALSRSGTSPNQMGSDLDLNSNDILNVGTIGASDIVVDGVSIDAKVTAASNSASAAATSASNAASSATSANSSAMASADSATASANSASEAEAALATIITGPATSVVNDVVLWNSTDGKIIKDSGKALPTGAVVGTTDVQTLTNKTLVAPALGTPASGVLTNATGLPLSTGVTGNLPVTNLNSGTSASSSTYWRGDGTWSTPSGGGGNIAVATRTALAALTGATAPVVILEEAGRQGTFIWNGANLSTSITSDPGQGIYVPPSTDTTGASGAWVRITIPGIYYATWFGVIGDGTDQTTAFGNMLTTIPTATGGTVYLGGTIVVTSINLNGRRNIIFLGTSGIGAGAGESTMLQSATTGTGRIIDLRASTGIEFNNIYFNQTSSSFTGTFIDLNDTTSGTTYFAMRNCNVNTVGACKSLSLYGATEWTLQNNNFLGKGSIYLQNATAVGFCNVGLVEHCSFHPSGSQYPFVGSGEVLTFSNNTFEADSGDGIGRAFQSSTAQPCKGLSFINNGFFDCTAGGGIWISIYAGEAIHIAGNRMGGFTGSYAVNLGGSSPGVNGFSIIGNSFDTFSAGIGFGGVFASGTGSSKGFVAGNVAVGGTTLLYGSYNTTQCDDIFTGFNYVATSATAQGSNVNILGIPTASTGLVSGDLYSNSGVLTRVP